MTSTALLTDMYELTMIKAAMHAGKAFCRCTFDLLTRRLHTCRSYGVVAGTGRALEALNHFRFGLEEIEFLRDLLPVLTCRRQAERVTRIGAGYRREHQRGVRDRSGDRAIDRGAAPSGWIRDTRHPPRRRLESHHAAPGRRLPNRGCQIAALRQRSKPGCYRRRCPARRAARRP